MAQSGQRKCLCCKLFFDPDHRNRERQRYCSQPECRRSSKSASQGAWLAKPDNRDYFRDPVHVTRVQAWRAAHPGYSRGKRRRPAPLQDTLSTQELDLIEETVIHGESAGVVALQDPLIALSNGLPPVLVGLIAHLFEVTLQEDIAATTRRLVQLGHDVINRSGGDEETETGAAPRAAAPGARAVQLG